MQYKKIAGLINAAEKANKKISQIVIEEEVKELEVEHSFVIKKMKDNLKIMREAIEEGLESDHKSNSGLSGGDAFKLNKSNNFFGGKLYKKVITKALAISEVNACMGKIVAGPTAGASGIVPAVLISLKEEYEIDEEKLINALFTAGGLGEIVSEKATLAGAAAGCQAECGVGSAMAAGAACELLGGSPKEVGDGFALALKNLLGLVCDPVAGLVEVPCVKRNGFASAHALTAANMALNGIKSVIPPDEVISAMMEIGDLMPNSLKETSKAGLAKTETGKEIAEKIKNL